MDEKFQHIFPYIRSVAHELATSAATKIRGYLSTIFTLKFQFKGAVTSERTLVIEENTESTVVNVEVDPSKHKHTVATLDTPSMYGTNKYNSADTAVLRTADNKVYATGTGDTNTGYVLSNGEDIASLFIPKNDSNFTVKNVDINNSGSNAIMSMQLTKEGNQFVLTKNWDFVCNCSHQYYCECCD